MNRILILLATAATFMVMKSCVNHDFGDSTTELNTDQSLFDEVTETGYEYYQNGSLLSPDPASPHGLFKLRFNSIAASSLDNAGELPGNVKFAEGSIIVKEAYQNNAVAIYAVMKKASGDASAGEGWLWSEYALDGTALYSIEGKGVSCIGCHNDTPNRDLVRTFDLH